MQKNSRQFEWVIATLTALLISTSAFAQDAFTEPASEKSAEAAMKEARPRAEAELAEAAAWEYRPYEVAVWVCADGSPQLMANLAALGNEVGRRAELIDPSGWNLTLSKAPSKWKWAFMSSLHNPSVFREKLIATEKKMADLRRDLATAKKNKPANPDGKAEKQIQDLADRLEALDQVMKKNNLAQLEVLEGYDKLMVICLREKNGTINCQARELDIRTQQWGPLQERNASRFQELSSAMIHAISRAFMPIARVERVTEADEVFVRPRATRVCERAEMTDEGEWTVASITDSPVWINDDDRFLPVIRRTDRQGNLVRLEAIDFTFLNIEALEGPSYVCSIQSFHRAPMSGRKSKRAQKLALVIRPPERATTLKLVSRGEDSKALEGYEVWSRYPGQPKPVKGEPASKETESELLGYTDWRGQIDIYPSEHGIRLLYIKNGSRALKKLPMIPGFHSFLETTVPDDETRLYAEGIISGLNNEILNLVAQRQVYESEIDDTLEKNKLDEARELLAKYQDLTTPQDLKIRLADEESRLQSRTDNTRELEYITSMFDTLRAILDSKAVKSKESDLLERLQNASTPSAEPTTN